MTFLLVWMDAHPWTLLAVPIIGSAACLALAAYWPLRYGPPDPFPPALPSGLVRRVPLRPFDWQQDAPEIAAGTRASETPVP